MTTSKHRKDAERVANAMVNSTLEIAATLCDAVEKLEAVNVEKAVATDSVTGGATRLTHMAAQYTARNLAASIRRLKDKP